MEKTSNLSVVKAPKKLFNKYDKSESIISWLMISPMVIGFFVFTIYPILWVYRYSFFDYDGIRESFVGFENFIRAFTRDPKFWKSILNTFIISFGSLAVAFPLSLGLAIGINQNIRGSIVYRVGFYLPSVISTAVVGLIFCFLFSAYNGPINNILENMGIISNPVNWFDTKWKAMFVIIVAIIWQSYCQNMIFFLAALQGIPLELYEAADIDGANSWSKFVNVTIPQLMPTIKVLLMMSIVYAMKGMDSVMVITNGAPAGETDVVMLYIYRFFFETNGAVKQWGYASSLGMITSVIIAALTVIYLKVTNKNEAAN